MTAPEFALRNPSTALAGTDLRIHLPLDRALVNKLLAERPSGTPVRELYLDPDPNGQLHVHIGIDVPVVGRQERRLTLVPGPAVRFPEQPWLEFAITDGFRFLDKPLIGLLRGQLEKRLPRGVEFSADALRLHVPALLTGAGRQELSPLIQELRVTSADNRLVLDLHLSSKPTTV